MRILVSKQNIGILVTAEQKAKILASGRWKREAERGLIDAGRRTRTQVQRAVFRQMGLKGGQYSSEVARHTRSGLTAPLTFQIWAVRGGQRIELYKGLRVLKVGGRTQASRTAGHGAGPTGQVQSGVWNIPRVFKRSFQGTQGGYFALLPGSQTTRAPKAFWTWGNKPNQPRDASGRFAQSSARYGKVRRLFGASLRKELVKDQSLATFESVAPTQMRIHVAKRMEKLLKF